MTKKVEHCWLAPKCTGRYKENGHGWQVTAKYSDAEILMSIISGCEHGMRDQLT